VSAQAQDCTETKQAPRKKPLECVLTQESVL